MANIKVESKRPLFDGMAITFKAPCECSTVEGLTVAYEGVSQNFIFRDAHGNVLTGIGNLFEEGAYVQAILDTVNGYAYLQNADTNSYLESKFLVESDEYPGCYYRIVNGLKEWQNPPMVAYKGYRTTERFDGETVYVSRITHPSLKGAGESVGVAFTGGDFGQILSLSTTYYKSDDSGIIRTYSDPLIIDGSICASAHIDNTTQRLVFESYSDAAEGFSASCVIKLTQA